jgi:hypothetical protein
MRNQDAWTIQQAAQGDLEAVSSAVQLCRQVPLSLCCVGEEVPHGLEFGIGVAVAQLARPSAPAEQCKQGANPVLCHLDQNSAPIRRAWAVAGESVVLQSIDESRNGRGAQF